MAAKHTSGTGIADAVTRIAEGIGEVLGRVVNRLEKMDKIDKVDRLGAAQAGADGTRHRVGSQAKRPGAPTASRQTAVRAPRSQSGSQKATKRTVTCSVCGALGHNARGHARWHASQG